MSTIGVITFIIVLLAALVCYAFIAQTITQKRQKRERLIASLKARTRNFKYMLGSTPAGYLPKDLKLLVQRSLEQVCEQLSNLEPMEASHKEDLQLVTQQMAETQRQNDLIKKQSLDNPQQGKEIKACLEELYKFVFQLEGKRALTRPQADSYRAMIKQLVLELTVDSYVVHGRIAKDKEKYKLAAHYFELGLKLLIREGKNGQFDGRIAQLKQAITELQPKLKEEEGLNIPIPPDEESSHAGWDEFGKDDSSWKKKQIYD